MIARACAIMHNGRGQGSAVRRRLASDNAVVLQHDSFLVRFRGVMHPGTRQTTLLGRASDSFARCARGVRRAGNAVCGPCVAACSREPDSLTNGAFGGVVGGITILAIGSGASVVLVGLAEDGSGCASEALSSRPWEWASLPEHVSVSMRCWKRGRTAVTQTSSSGSDGDRRPKSEAHAIRMTWRGWSIRG